MTTFGLSALFWSRRSGLDRETLAGYLSALVMIAIHLALVQMGQTAAARLAAIVAAMVTLPLGLELLGRPEIVPVAAAFVGCAGAAAMCGLVSMEMLLGLAYVGTDKMSTAPLRRMNFVFAAVLLLRIFVGVCAMLMEHAWPVEWFWDAPGPAHCHALACGVTGAKRAHLHDSRPHQTRIDPERNRYALCHGCAGFRRRNNRALADARNRTAVLIESLNHRIIESLETQLQ